MSLCRACHVGTGTATARTSWASSLATADRHIAGMCRTVGACALSTSAKEGARSGHGPVVGAPGLGVEHACGGGCKGTGTRGSSAKDPCGSAAWEARGPSGVERQLLHLEPAGTRVRQGAQFLRLRSCMVDPGTTCPCETCTEARWEIKAVRDLVVVEAGHSRNGQAIGAGAGPGSSSSDDSRRASSGGQLLIRTGTLGVGSACPCLELVAPP